MSSLIGKKLVLSVFGESHGAGIGAVVDGFPPGFEIDTEELSAFMARRRPGRDSTSTRRKEDDIPEILSGVLGGTTCGTPIAAVIRNTDQHSRDYGKLKNTARPGHADYTGFLRYRGFNDIRGGGHFSGRLTAPIVFAGGICKQYLESRDIYVGAHLKSVAGIEDASFDAVNPEKEDILAPGRKGFPVIDGSVEEAMRNAIDAARLDGDSVGGIVEAAVVGMPAGIGSPMFDTVEGRLAMAYYGIPAVKGVSFGAGFKAAGMRGSENNDPFTVEGGVIRTATNNHGGVLGGITTGMPVIAHIAFKPTPSVSKLQRTVDFKNKTEVELEVTGRHDPCVAVRAVPVAEAVTAFVLTDMLLEQEGY